MRLLVVLVLAAMCAEGLIHDLHIHHDSRPGTCWNGRLSGGRARALDRILSLPLLATPAYVDVRRVPDLPRPATRPEPRGRLHALTVYRALAFAAA